MPYWIYIKRVGKDLRAVKSFLTREDAEKWIEKQLAVWRNYTSERPAFTVYYGSEAVLTIEA